MAKQKYYKFIEDDDAFRRLDVRHVIIGSIVFAIAGTIAFIVTRHIDLTLAADLSKFQAGYIISDYMMTKSDSMTEAEIQTFLKSKNNCNDTNISKADNYPNLSYHIEDGHFVCMADELFENQESGKQETAAHIIWQAAQDYKINPQVLIVLLEKEQGLVSDTWPNDRQYKVATGYGCPDNAACDTKYYGFRNQIRNAANLFHTVMTGGWTNYPLGDNYIQYNPNKSCGGSVVNIKNLATSALYRYTPYQPNAAAIAAYTGTAQCGAYGNRNFYIYFENWFGNITASAPNTTASTTTQNSSSSSSSSNGSSSSSSSSSNSSNSNSSTNSSSSTAADTTKNTVYSSFKSYESQVGSMTNDYKTVTIGNKKLTVQEFQKAVLIEDDKTIYQVPNKVYSAWNENQSTLGMIKSGLNEATSTKMQWYDFENGKIVGNDSKGWYISVGGSRKVWENQGFEYGTLGFPKSNLEKNSKTGIEWQVYEGGLIVGNDKKGWFLSMGGSRKVWESLGFEGGVLGFPTSNFSCNKATGMCWQTYEGGLIVGNDKKGWYESRGNIRTKWQKSGFEYGSYGFPTSNIINGKYQKYEHGTIYM